ncbi:hypothetical protein CSOJ01_05628 [Colletotrichum sojae]|uniref:Uncharacterized protein n=1 Tax=Colletotrichum sojae TaxID=2175907 RepID=A0A8H6JEG5_9PEZI|nr:hypothetical protein CSOJ01_05628 [Colletotrichum sojae]
MLPSFPESPYVADANSPRLSELERKSKGKGKGKGKGDDATLARQPFATNQPTIPSLLSPDNQPVAAGVAQASGSSSPEASDSATNDKGSQDKGGAGLGFAASVVLVLLAQLVLPLVARLAATNLKV